MDIRNNGWVATILALSALSCGDALPPPAEGAVAISLRPSSSPTPGYSCESFSLSWTSNGISPTISSPGGLLVDRQGGADVSCRASGKGTYNVSGTVGGGRSGEFSFSGTVNEVAGTDGTNGTVSVSFYDIDHVRSLQGIDCTVSLGTDADSLTVESGALWATIACGKLTSPDDRGLWCAANAIVVFKSCDE